MFSWVSLFDLRRRRLRKRTAPGILRDYLDHPLPAGNTPCAEVPFLALDMETTGLDATRHEILTIGFVPLVGGVVRLSESGHLLIKPLKPIPPETVVLHGLTDDRSAQGAPLAEVFPTLLQAMAGRVLLVHYAPLERAFLRQAFRRLHGVIPPTLFVDVMALEIRRMQRMNHHPLPGELRLAQLRGQYGLPRYRAHNALSDALATAELFLAQQARQGDTGNRVALRKLLVW
ncbi:MAG: hypothetical protein HQL66_12760 [Magnetococcales bacterium]|nr:hypothetical protein [Magnetococcales bacterium]